MYCEQAIFTSLKTRRQEGYQLAAASPGLSSEIIKELAQWGPAHDSLVENTFGATSTNFHQLDGGDYCVSRTVAEGNEYSGRAGPRIYTQLLILKPELFAKFANNPFSVLEAVAASGHLKVYDQPPPQLEPIRLLGRASLVNQLRLAELSSAPGWEHLLRLLHVAITSARVAVRSSVSLERLFAGMLSLLPLRFRTQFSFSTGLRYSAQRPVRLMTLGPDSPQQRSSQRSSGAVSLDLASEGLPALKSLEGRWVRLLRDIFQAGQLSVLPELLRRAERFDPAEHTLDEIALCVEDEVRAEAS
jgi:hypothetical protein